jgi:5-methylcytosine-specific restriction enzyme A
MVAVPKSPRRIKMPRGCIAPEAERRQWAGNNARKRAIRGHALQKARARLFREKPLCVECEKEGKVKLAVIRDHTLALAFGGTDTDDNIQGLCKRHHDAKTRQESIEGKRRKKVGR